jgi:hypothetical protein
MEIWLKTLELAIGWRDVGACANAAMETMASRSGEAFGSDLMRTSLSVETK